MRSRSRSWAVKLIALPLALVPCERALTKALRDMLLERERKSAIKKPENDRSEFMLDSKNYFCKEDVFKAIYAPKIMVSE